MAAERPDQAGLRVKIGELEADRTRLEQQAAARVDDGDAGGAGSGRVIGRMAT